MRNYNTIYQSYIDEKLKIPASKIKRGNFYLLKSYKNVDGIKTNYNEMESPIIFVLYTSKKNDEIHAVKLSNVKPDLIKKLFTKLINTETGEIELKGQSKRIYESTLKKIPNVTNESYRTYKWSGIQSIFELNIEEDKLHSNKKSTPNKKSIRYTDPNFEYEWEEAERYPEFVDMGKEKWIALAKRGYIVKFSKIKNVLGNVDLNFNRLRKDKRERFEKAFNNGIIERSIVVKFSDNDYDLVAGNTRLSGQVKHGIDPELWVVDLSNKK